MRKLCLIAAAFAAALMSQTAFAATTTTTFGVSATVAATCVINSASALAFGTVGALAANVDQTSTIDVKCTNTTPFNIGLGAGTATGATVTTRKMTGAGASPATLSFSLYSDTGRTTNWGNTVATDTVASTGTGSSQTFTVYGRIPVQTAPKPDTYSDTITVTVTY
ncbi:Csu type fimbrial protein [Allomesorhizobium camelthorni]|uniref:Spore coat U domain-containing protein n=1 Tax=Allomesorhizobium camelthorni TaxID=475069 RepID=A0A6G4WK39_9HYPH|nr:spore coat U domain-containing protein [Mesorhizobium camelthorni]NGO54553.1 spore coat U domain-containing protein [Mesorhizobium camelthorni]